MHTQSRILAKAGNYYDAIRILEQLISSLIKLPEADREKERQFAPVLLTLSTCLLEVGNYDRVLEVSNLGAEYSAARKQGQLNPDFEFCIALALQGLNRPSECRIPLQHAYFGFMLLGKYNQANEVLYQAREVFGINYDIHRVDEIDFSHQLRIPYNRGEPVDCDSLGSMIRALRKRAGLSLEQLCNGICSKPTLLRIEKDESHCSVFTLEALMQRLGRDISLYKNFFLSKEDFLVFQLRDRINTLLMERRYPDALILFHEFTSMQNSNRHSVLQQFAKMTNAVLHDASCALPNPDFPSMLLVLHSDFLISSSIIRSRA